MAWRTEAPGSPQRCQVTPRAPDGGVPRGIEGENRLARNALSADSVASARAADLGKMGMLAIAPENVPLVWFLSGVFAAYVGACLWRLGRFLIDLRITRRETAALAAKRPHDPRAEEAWQRVRACRKRLLLNPNPNPEWLAPLVDEIPRLLREIAAIYYPRHAEPLHAPRMSEFARAVQFAAMDTAEMLQSRRMGRLIDISAGRTVQAWRTGHRVWTNPKFRKARGIFEPAYRVGKPLWQVLKYKSPITWVSIAASNAAIRTLQPAVINIVARHAIDLYSGRLGDAARLPRSVRPGELRIENGGDSPGAPATSPGRLRRVARKLRFWEK